MSASEGGDRISLPGATELEIEEPPAPPAAPRDDVRPHAVSAPALALVDPGALPDSTQGGSGVADSGAVGMQKFRQLLDGLFEEHCRVVEELRFEHRAEVAELSGRLGRPGDSSSTPREDLRTVADAFLMKPTSTQASMSPGDVDLGSSTPIVGFSSFRTLSRRADRPLLLCIVIEDARDLRNADGYAGTSDPYCVVEVLGQGELRRTQVIDNTLHPTWNFASILRDVSPEDTLAFTVYDHDYGSQDDVLGHAQLPCREIPPCGFDGELPLEDSKRGDGDTQAYLRIKAIFPGAASRELSRDPHVPLAVVWTCGVGMADPAKDAATRMELSPRTPSSMLKRQDLMTTAQAPAWKGCLLHPESRFRITWDLMSVVALLMDLIWIPMQVFDPPQTTGSMVYAMAGLLYWGMDIPMTCNTMYYATDGTLVRSRKKIYAKYFKSWMVIDLAIVILEFFIVSVTVSESISPGESAGAARASRLTRLARIFRMLRLMRLPKLRKAIFAIQGLIESEIMIVVFTVARNLFAVLMCTHIIACGWFVVGDVNSDGWVATEGYRSVSFLARYITSLQWSLAQFTPGASPVQTRTVGEQVYAVCVLAFGMVVATCFVSSITSTMSALWTVGNYHRTQSMLLKKFLHQNRVPRELGYRIIRYVDFVVEFRHRRVPKSSVKYLDLISGPLHLQLRVELFLPRLGAHPCFAQIASASRAVFSEICSAGVGSTQFARTDIMFSPGKVAKEMIFVTQGSAAYRFLAESGEERRLLDTGMWCAEVALWMEWRFRGEMKALNSIDTLNVSATKFADIMRSMEAYTFAQAHAIAFWRRMQQQDCEDNAWALEVVLLRDTDGSPQAQGETGARFKLPGTNAFEHRARIEVKRAEETQAQQFPWDCS